MKQSIKQHINNAICKGLKKALHEYQDFDFSKTRGIALPDPDEDEYAYSSKEIKVKLKALQDALQDVLELCNGAQCGEELTNILWDECYNFHNFINQFVTAETEEDLNVPFLRTYDEDYGIQPYYDTKGNQKPWKH